MDAINPVPFGEWLPDLGAFRNPGALTVKNCLALGDRYTPFYEALEAADALPGDCKGGIAYRDAAGDVTIFAATLTKIYQLNGTAWDEVTRAAGGDYATPVDGFWDFLIMGTIVIATNYTDDIQAYDIAADSQFSQMSATAPKCRRMFVANNYLVCLDTVDADGAQQNRARWSPLNNPKGDWTSAPTTTGADFQNIGSGSYANVFGAALEDQSVIVQGRMLWRMDYVGGSEIFTFTPIANSRGSLLPRSCISNGSSVFLKDEAGYYEYSPAQGVVPIGHSKIDKTFTALFDQAFDYNMNAASDPLGKQIMWAFPGIDADNGICNYILAFSWVDRRWTLIEEVTQVLFSYLSTGKDLEDLDAVASSVDALPFSLDSPLYTGGKTVIGSFTANRKLAAFTGAAKTATIGTSEIRGAPGNRSILSGLIAYVEGSAAVITARLGMRDFINKAVEWTEFVPQNDMTGEIDFLHEAVFHRAEVQISGDWSTADGLSPRWGGAGVA